MWRRSLVLCGSAMVCLSGCECSAPSMRDDGGRQDASVDGATDAGTDADPDGGHDAAALDASADAGAPECTTTAPEAFLDALVAAACAGEVRCRTYLGMGEGTFSCHDVVRLILGPTRDLLLAGRLSLDPAHACACIQAIATRCGGAPACAEVLVGLGPGAACALDGECGAYGMCDRGAVGSACPGRCVALPTEGEACRESSPRCGGALHCIDGACSRGRALGEACDPLDHPCRYDLFCDFDTNVCRAPAGEGEGCNTSPGSCGGDLVCTGGPPGCLTGSAEGEPCGSFVRCALGHYCNAGTCIRIRTPGQACDSDAQCTSGFVCDGTCVRLPLVGEACLDGRCLTGTCADGTCVESADGAACRFPLTDAIPECEGRCDLFSRECRPAVSEGGACTSAECDMGLECRVGVCKPGCMLD